MVGALGRKGGKLLLGKKNSLDMVHILQAAKKVALKWITK